ncbi:DUF6630 family protein [Nocardia sp. R16R-3T]
MIFQRKRRTALRGIVGLLAPDIDEARERLNEVLEDLDWDDYSAEEVLIDALYDAEAFDEPGSGLVYFDWKAEPQELRDGLQLLPRCPRELAWDWYEHDPTAASDPDGRDEFLWQLADRCQQFGVAIISVYVDGDGFTLGFLPASQLSELMKLASSAKARIDVIRSGEPTP